MEPGQFRVRGTFCGFLVLGLPSMSLFFKRKGEKRESEVLGAHTKKNGYQCRVCSSVFIERLSGFGYSPSEY